MVSAVVAAIAASACCWLPMLLVALGVSAGGVAAAFERARSLALIIAAALWSIAFLIVYGPRRACDDDRGCAPRPPSAAARIGVWASLVLVIAFATLPSWLAAVRHRAAPTTTAAAPSFVIAGRVDGMTCAACAPEIETALERVPGVLSARVEFPDGATTVRGDQARPPDPRRVRQAVQALGYRFMPSAPPDRAVGR